MLVRLELLGGGLFPNSVRWGETDREVKWIIFEKIISGLDLTDLRLS